MEWQDRCLHNYPGGIKYSGVCLWKERMELGGQPKDQTWFSTIAWLNGWMHLVYVAEASECVNDCVLYEGHGKGQLWDNNDSLICFSVWHCSTKYLTTMLVLFNFSLNVRFKAEVDSHSVVVYIHLTVVHQLTTMSWSYICPTLHLQR